MNQNTFFVAFIIVTTAIGLVLKEYTDMDLFSEYSIVFMVMAYFAGRYSTKFSKK